MKFSQSAQAPAKSARPAPKGRTGALVRRVKRIPTGPAATWPRPRWISCCLRASSSGWTARWGIAQRGHEGHIVDTVHTGGPAGDAEPVGVGGDGRPRGERLDRPVDRYTMAEITARAMGLTLSPLTVSPFADMAVNAAAAPRLMES